VIVGLFALKRKKVKKTLSNNFPIFCHYETQRKLRFESNVVIVFGEIGKKKKKKRKKKLPPYHSSILNKSKTQKMEQKM
jgi:hypothetical protein